MFGLLQSLGVKGTRGFLGLTSQVPCLGRMLYTKALCLGSISQRLGNSWTSWGFNSTGPNIVASVNAQPAVLESLPVKVSMFKLNP